MRLVHSFFYGYLLGLYCTEKNGDLAMGSSDMWLRDICVKPRKFHDQKPLFTVMIRFMIISFFLYFLPIPIPPVCALPLACDTSPTTLLYLP
jgi:hypothetical protein